MSFKAYWAQRSLRKTKERFAAGFRCAAGELMWAHVHGGYKEVLKALENHNACMNPTTFDYGVQSAILYFKRLKGDLRD